MRFLPPSFDHQWLGKPKLRAMVYLGMPNTRMKDFLDIWFLCREFSFDGPLLRQRRRLLLVLHSLKTACCATAP